MPCTGEWANPRGPEFSSNSPNTVRTAPIPAYTGLGQLRTSPGRAAPTNEKRHSGGQIKLSALVGTSALQAGPQSQGNPGKSPVRMRI